MVNVWAALPTTGLWADREQLPLTIRPLGATHAVTHRSGRTLMSSLQEDAHACASATSIVRALRLARRWRRALVAAAFAGGLLASAHAGGDGSDATLSTRLSTPETNAVYDFIKSRTTQLRSNMIEGQHFGGPGDLDADGAHLFDMKTYRIDSGQAPRHTYPRMVGARYDAKVGSTYTLDANSIDAINARLIEASAIYHPIISITATPLNPWQPDLGRTFSGKDGDLSDLYYEHRNDVGSPAAHFWADVKTIADGLAKLKSADGTPIPVVLRPFAEVNTNDKYYFRNKKSSEFVTLWKQVAKYYAGIRELHNIIFCWEAWVWHRGGAEIDIAPWLPTGKEPDGYPNPYVDIVSGAFYFQQGDTDFFQLKFVDGSADQTVFYALMKLAFDNDKPFGAAQWAVNYKYTPDHSPCVYGDNANALAFMKAVDEQHASPMPNKPVQHMAFAYYWGDNAMCMAVQNQANAALFADDPLVASVTGLDAVPTESGWVREKSFNTGVGDKVTPGMPLRNGDSAGGTNGCTDCQIRSVVSFKTQAALPLGASIDPASPTLVLTQTSLSAGGSPFDLDFAPLWVDASGSFGTGPGLAANDFAAGQQDQVHVAKMTKPANSVSHATSFATLPLSALNTGGRSQYRLSFEKTTDRGNSDTWVDWNGSGASAPELVFSYTVP
jgi:hypothetical protein